MMEPARSSETSVHTRATRRNIPEDGILQGWFQFIFGNYTSLSLRFAEIISFHKSSLYICCFRDACYIFLLSIVMDCNKHCKETYNYRFTVNSTLPVLSTFQRVDVDDQLYKEIFQKEENISEIYEFIEKCCFLGWHAVCLL
jgi:hypothetical protein